jgi:hypothetical protein
MHYPAPAIARVSANLARCLGVGLRTDGLHHPSGTVSGWAVWRTTKRFSIPSVQYVFGFFHLEKLGQPPDINLKMS